MKPMLAQPIKDVSTDVRFPCYASAKVDGVRGLVIDGVLRSRNLKPIKNKFVSKRFSLKSAEGYDGELIMGSPTSPKVFQTTQSACGTIEGEPDVTFYIFDCFSHPGGFIERSKSLKRLHLNMVLLEQKLILNQGALLAFEDECLDKGFEGLIVRSPHGAYKWGRSTIKEGGMLKLKRFEDSEALILEVLEEQQNNNEAVINELGRSHRSSHKANKEGKGRMGKLRCRDMVTGIEFKVGTGFDAAEREYYWEQQKQVVGRIIKYKSFPIGVKTKPRQPVYLGTRDSWDLS